MGLTPRTANKRGNMKHFLFCGIAFAILHNIYSDTPDFCLLPNDEGTGTNMTFLVYYDKAIDACYPFFYKGEGGNLNRFANERECIRTCSADAESKYPMDEVAACHLTYLKGADWCKGTSLRYYYDSHHDKCKKFLWTGCMGNGNRFFDQESCNATCAGVHDEGDQLEEDEPDTPVGLIAGILLGIIGAVIISLVIVLAVKSRKEKGTKKSKDAPAELPLQDRGTELA